MFGSSRRHRPPAQPLTKETANPNAATAAASAFMRREPSTSLSSAAAAAALRARPTTPTNVAQVQSKRVARRSASVSSTGSRDRGGRELHRAPSTGSMSDRTFRSPSPGRGAPPRSHDVPPVPSLPNDEQYKTESTNRPHKRATSLQIQPFRTASQKMQDGQGPSWFGAAAAGDMSNVRHSDALFEPRHSSDLRPSSPSSSINFSYPRSGSLESDRTMVYDANSRRMVPRVEILIREQTIRDASEKPVKKKKQVATQSGSYLKKGNMSRIKGTAVEAPVPPSTAPTAPQVSQRKANVQKIQRDEPKQTSKPEPPIKEQPAVEPESESESDFEEPANYKQEAIAKATILPPDNRSRSSPVKKKRPSVVHELPEPEDEYEQETQVPAQSQDTLVSDEVPVKSPPPIQTKPETTTVESEPRPPKAQAIPENRIETTPRARVHSESPARTPHFAPKTDQLLVIHEPPPRSLSPRKSAMKHRSPTRDASPSEDGSEASNALMSASSQEDAATARRRSIRVSFDDQNTFVVGESAEPAEPDLAQLPSPQTKKAWHNIINRPKRDSWSLDEDEKMTPRPALPSFGSIREKKPKDSEERPLVRPTERTWSPQITGVSSHQASPDQMSPADPGQSSDLAIGSILAQEQSSRNAANISKYREPLPPVVTSVDSPGYISNSPLSSDDEIEMPAQEPTKQRAGDDLPNHQNLTTAESGSNESIPMISISHPSPRVQDDDQPDSPQDFFDLPGGFPDDDSSKSEESKTPPIEVVERPIPAFENDSSARTLVSHRPPPLTPQRSMDSAVGSPPSPQIHDIKEEEEESDGSSIYSDAYEDLSDIEGDGFMSLDAIVDSPVNKVSKKLFEKTVAKSKENDATKNTSPTNPAKREPLQTQDDWEHAKAYWRSLSTDKRRQLEQEAAEEAGEEADLEEAVPQLKKAKKRKSLEQRREQVISKEPRNPERVYQIQPGTSWNESEASESPVSVKAKSSGGSKLRKSMRGEEPKPLEQSRSIQPGGMRMSMRSGGAPATTSNEGHMRKSLRAESEKAPAAGTTKMQKSMRPNGRFDDATSRSSQKNQDRPVSYQPPTTEPVRNSRRNQSADRATSSATMIANSSTKPSLRRRGSDSSESSFRRSRPGAGEGFGFKRTMRGSAREPVPVSPPSDAGKSSSRFSLRSLSPTGSAFRRNSGTVSPPPVIVGGRIRQSMRGDSSDRSTSSLRVSGFGRSSNKKAKKGRSNSRFVDSSDEEDARPTTRSRFADSSDEDGTPLPKLKGNGVPKTMRNKSSSSAAAAAMGVPQSQREDEDSPDLPDSDDEIEQPQPVVPSSSVAASKKGTTLSRNGSGRDNLRPTTATQPANAQVPGGPRPGHTRRGSLMSILRRKKDGGGKVSRPVSESAARRDTRLERSTDELAVIRSTSGQHNSRLQKRSPNWPLQEDADTHPQDDGYGEDESHDTYVNEEKRPSTASGAAPTSPTSKPGFLKRRSTSQGALGLSHNDTEINGPLPEHHDGSHDQPESQKKKKFGSLRKIFGLHD